MKKILFFAAAILCVMAANAATWRVNYNDPEHADFKTLKLATESSEFQAGDIIYVEPGIHNGSQSDNTISKACTVIGPGWGFRQSTGNDLEISGACFKERININASNVTIMGIYSISDIYASPENAQNIVIERNYIAGVSSFRVDDLSIKNNYITSSIQVQPKVSLSIIGNIILGNVSIGSPSQAIFDHNTHINNTNYYNLGTWDPTRHSYTNNIIIHGNGSPEFIMPTFAANMPYENNVFSISAGTAAAAPDIYQPLTEAKHNLFIGATELSTCVCQTSGQYYDPAMYFRVLDSSPAKTAASDGKECGAFGGESPYVLNGRPNGIPYIYDVTVPKYPSNNQLNITFKVAGQNE